MQVCFRQVVSNGTSVLAIASGATCLSLGLLKLFSISLGIKFLMSRKSTVRYILSPFCMHCNTRMVQIELTKSNKIKTATSKVPSSTTSNMVNLVHWSTTLT